MPATVIAERVGWTRGVDDPKERGSGSPDACPGGLGRVREAVGSARSGPGRSNPGQATWYVRNRSSKKPRSISRADCSLSRFAAPKRNTPGLAALASGPALPEAPDWVNSTTGRPQTVPGSRLQQPGSMLQDGLVYHADLISCELARFPRDTRATPQNYYRAVFWAARAHGLGRRATIPPTFDAAVGLATQIIRRDFPGFLPTVAQDR